MTCACETKTSVLSCIIVANCGTKGRQQLVYAATSLVPRPSLQIHVWIEAGTISVNCYVASCL